MELKERLEIQTSHIEVSKQGLIDSLQAKGITPDSSSFEDIRKALDLVKVDPNVYSKIATIRIGYNIYNGDWYVQGKANGANFNNTLIYQPTKEKAMKALFDKVTVNMIGKLSLVKAERLSNGHMKFAMGGGSTTSQDKYTTGVIAGNFPFEFNGDYLSFSASQATPLMYLNNQRVYDVSPKYYILGILKELRSFDEYPEEKIREMQYGCSLIFDALDLGSIGLIRP